MIQFLRKLLLSFLVLLLLTISGSWLAIHYYGDDIKNIVVRSLNEQLRTKVEVKTVDISFWKSFPEVSVLFENALIYAVDSEKDTLIAAKTISANFNLIEIYRQNYTLTGLQIEEGICRLLVDHSGKTNYIFWETEAEDSSSSNFSIDLQKVVFKKIDFQFEQQANDFNLHFFIEEALISGNFSESIFDLTIKSTLKNSLIQNSDFTFVKDRTLFIYSQGRLDSKKEKIEFYDANLGIEGMNFALKGSILYGDEPRLQLEMSSGNTALEKAIQLLPPKIRATFNPYTINGETEINGSINGPISAIEQPSYQFNFSIKNGEFKDAANNLTFANSSLKGHISNGAANKAESSQIELNWFSTELNKGKIEGKLNIKNFIQPRYSFSGEMEVKLADAAAFFKWKELQKVAGSIDAKLQLSGSLQSTDAYTLQDWKHSKVSGDISLNDIAFYYGNGPQHFNHIRGNFKLDNNNVEVKSMHAAVNQSAFELQGRFNNLIGYLLEEDENIMIDAALRSSSIRLEDFLMSGQDEDTSAFQLEISPRINLYLQTEIDHLSFKTFELSRLMGQFVVRNEQIDFRNIHFESNGGEVDGELFIRENGSQLNTYAKLDFKAINIQSLFQSFNNFGQESLKAENINGIASATVDYSCVWSKSLVTDLNSLKVESNLFIENGELINYKPLESLSKFVELEELKHIRFKNLNNHILIKDRIVFIPRFDVNSSALNVEIAGSHSFDNEIDYKFTLLLNEILGKKAKKPKSNEFGYVEDDGLGRTKLFLKMTGTVDNPEISYDKDQLKTHIKTTVDQEKTTVKRLLNEEFGMFKKDSLGKKEPISTKEKKQPYTIEWDEKPETGNSPKSEASSKESDKKKEKKSRFGKFIDKIAEPNDEEYVEPYKKD